MSQATEARAMEEPSGLLGECTKFLKTSVGSKVAMAISGLIMGGFIIGHMAGNLAVFGGKDAINTYAYFLHSQPLLLWAVRGGLVLSVTVHILLAIRTHLIVNAAARPVPYAFKPSTPRHWKKFIAGWSGKYAIWSGLLIFSYLIFHLVHFTFCNAKPTTRLLVNGQNITTVDVYKMMVDAFNNPLIAGTYLLALVLLASHLSHGIYSLCQHLGLFGKTWTPLIQFKAKALAYAICAAFASIPLAVLCGIIQ
ncbi:MAG: succinate dehydrogenase cytochrome b subunit [Cystobacterineae bacterium]|nr:succinate dehydrogenase cytochrome b subunit [Cystobacterineae bacterium]